MGDGDGAILTQSRHPTCPQDQPVAVHTVLDTQARALRMGGAPARRALIGGSYQGGPTPSHLLIPVADPDSLS